LAGETQKRKSDHIKICLEKKAQARRATTGFEDIGFVHRALPEIDKQKIDLSTYLFGHKFKAPLIVNAMTGGTNEAKKINANIAQAAEALGLGMGVGSQRAAIEDPKLVETFAIARKKAPNAFLVANLGGVQLVHGFGLREVKKAVEMIEADALAIHLNALQEAVQPKDEGQTNFEGILAKIIQITGELDVPVIVKETGAGISAEDAKELEEAGVKAIDVGGLGGTTFAAVEYFRTEEQPESVEHHLGAVFWDWGIPTAASIVEVAKTVKVPLIASGGLRDGVDLAKALALGASLGGLSQPVLRVADRSAAETEAFLSLLVEELKNVMFLVGTKNVEELAKSPLVVMGKTAKWLNTRGFDVKGYARRGA
jgi:isopentenyl-diphosphate Delta-isomerase